MHTDLTYGNFIYQEKKIKIKKKICFLSENI